MRRKTFSILFFLRKGKLLKNGEAPICMRITVNGKTSDIQIKRSIPVEHWNQSKECSKAKGRSSEELNTYLDSIRSRLFQIYRELEEEEKDINSDIIKKRFFGSGEKRRSLLDVFNEHNTQCRQLIGKDFVEKTVQRYETTAKYLLEFMEKQYDISDIALNDIDPAFIRNFDVFLKVEKNCAQNAAITRLKGLKKIIRIAMDNEWIKKNPFAGIKFKQEQTNPEFLTMEELQIILSKKITIKRLENVRDVFIFCCFTGLAFVDVQQLKPEHIIKSNSGEIWIRKNRQKTKNMCNIPLLQVPQQLIDKYAVDLGCRKKGVLFPVPCNQRMNSYLKEIADICKIDKKLTTHVARHTFATSVTLGNNVSMENVSKMLGHSDTTITKHYARVLDKSILSDMQKVNSELSGLAI